MTTEERPPRRLAESSGMAGEVVRRALCEQELVAPLPRFTQLQERRLSRSRRQAAALLAVAAAALLIGLRSLRPSEAPVTVRAEPPVAATPALASSASALASAEERPALPPLPSKPVPKREPSSKPRVAPASSAPTREAEVAPAPAASELHGSAKSCAELARSGAVEPALGCYAALSSGSGVSAELALFEQARLAGKVLRQPARALALLEAYRTRFPNGSLRAEAMLARIEWSLAAGDSARARAGVEEALASGLLQERRAELERLRASLPGSAPATESP